MQREFLKVGHLFFIIVWLGTLMLLSYLMSLRNGKTTEHRLISLPLIKKLYLQFQLPAMILAIVFGIALLVTKLTLFKQIYFHIKLTFVLLLIILDLFFCALLWTKKEGLHLSRSLYYRAIFLAAIIIILSIIFTIYVVKVML